MKTLIIAILLFITAGIQAQINTNWDETYGGEENDAAANIIELRDGNFLVVGYTESQGAGKKDGWAVKISPSGEQIWDMPYGGPSDDEFLDAVELPDGKLAMVGYTKSMGAGKSDFWLVVADKEGDQQWEKTYGGDKDDGAQSVILSYDGKLVISGYTKSRGAGNRDFWVIKVDQNGIDKDQGKIIWKRNAGGKKADFPSVIKQDPKDSSYYVLGTTTSFGNGSGDAWLIRILDGRGMVRGKKFFGYKQYEYGNDFYFTDEHGYFMVGATMSNSKGLFDGWVIKLNDEYDSYFIKSFGGQKEDKFMSMVKHNDDYLIAGYTASDGEGEYDGWLMLITEKGVPVWQTTVGEVKSDKFFKIIKSKDGNYLAVGSTTSKGDGKSDFWVVNFNVER